MNNYSTKEDIIISEEVFKNNNTLNKSFIVIQTRIWRELNINRSLHSIKHRYYKLKKMNLLHHFEVVTQVANNNKKNKSWIQRLFHLVWIVLGNNIKR